MDCFASGRSRREWVESLYVNYLNTFRIIARLWHFETQARHPLIRLERKHAPRWDDYKKYFRLLIRRAWQVGLFLLAVGACMEVFSLARVSFLMLSVTVFIPMIGIVLMGGAVLVIFLWPLLIASAGGGVIAWEKEIQTWNLLLVTPIARLDILLSKLVVGLSRLERFIVLSMGLQFFPMLAVASLIGGLFRQDKSIAPMLAMGLGIFLFVVEKMQTFVLAGLLGLTASLTAGSWSLGMVGSVALGSLMIIVRTMLTYAIMAIMAGGKLIDTSPAIILGFSAVANAGRDAWTGLFILAGLIALQELVIALLLRWIIHKMGGD